jgi:tRNA threonylcarbamoyl adenosine modification protein YjeE
MTLTLALANEAATAQMMADLALLTGPGDVIALRGDLGAGKTAAARAFLRYLAGDDELEVPSPTFTLAQTYELGACSVMHADLYRIADPIELEEIGLSPLPEGIIALIEWPERAEALLPGDALAVHLQAEPERRAILEGAIRWRCLEASYV